MSAERLLPTLSAHHRTNVCPASEAYPHAGSVSAQSEAGNVLHRFLQRVPEVGRDNALEEAPESHREALALIDLDKLPASEPDKYRPEVKLAYDVDSGEARILGTGGDRDYSEASPRELCGSLDVLGQDNGVALVLDYKRNWAPAKRATDNWQLKGGALFAARALGLGRARGAIVRVFDDGTTWTDVAEYSEDVLTSHEMALYSMVERVEEARAEVALGGEPKVIIGDHCKYCPALPFCPGQRGLLRAVTFEPAGFEGEVVAAITPANAGAAWAMVRAAEAVVKRTKELVEAFIRQQERPVPMPGGGLLGTVSQEREGVVDANVVHRVLLESYGPEVAEAAAPQVRNATKESIKRALRTVVDRTPGAKITKVTKAAIDSIREAGGMRTTISVSVGEVEKPKPESQPELPEEAA